MHDRNRVDQGRIWRALALLITVGVLAGPVSGQQRHDLEDGTWVAQPVAEPGSPGGQLDAIRKLIAQGEGKKAKHAADDWIEKHSDHPLLPEAYLVRGDANVARKHFFKSLYDYEYVIREFTGSEQFHTAMRREFELAKLFAAGTNRRLWGMRILPATDEAEEILVRIQERSPGSDLGEMASILLADYYFDKPQMDSAAEAYDLFLINYPRSEQREWAMLRLIQANLARFKGPRFDATGLIDAGQRLKTYRAEYPASAERIGVGALLIRIDESLAMRDMIAAGWHIKRKQPLSAVYLYQRVVQDYPQTAAAQDAVRELEAMGAPVVPTEELDPAAVAYDVTPEASTQAQTPIELPPAEPITEPAVEPTPAVPATAPAETPMDSPDATATTRPQVEHAEPEMLEPTEVTQPPETQPAPQQIQPEPATTQPEKP